jgi:hypothetical protein
MSVGVADDCDKALKRLIPALENRDSLYEPALNDFIAEGSYILTMQTRDGRTAKVIFAPGEESLKDIECMIGTEDFGDIAVRKLQQVRLVGKGGCRMLSNAL